MHKFMSIVTPYILVGVILAIHFVDFSYNEIVQSCLLGVLIGTWFLNLKKTEGTKGILIGLMITFILLVVGGIVSFIYLYDILASLMLCLILQLFALYIVSKNKPKLTMSYKYSYKTKRKRYF